ncbi:hypothetical protein P692DRAFT_201068112 [Suillus brevipes Sb2]|nr:hypothetical protein P692DRAFT_201068112 [Suillus brevipes Sb2]
MLIDANKKYLVQLPIQGCVSLCREEVTRVQADIECHFNITELLAIVLLTNEYNSLPLNVNTHTGITSQRRVSPAM